MSIGVSGLMSGLDTESIISQFMQVERRPIMLLQHKETGYQARISAMGGLKGALSSLRSAVSPLRSSLDYNQLRVSSGNSEVLTASASGSAIPGKYQIEVTALARAQQVRSAPFASSDTEVGAGTLTLQVGSGEAVTLTIDESNNTLADIASAINDAGAGVTASVIHDGTGNYYLTLAADKSGAENTISLSMEDADGDNTDAAGLSSLYSDPENQELAETQAARNAELSLNGVAVERPENTITDLVNGVTVTLKKEEPGKPFELTITRDTAVIAGRLREFVKQYNALADTLKGSQGYNPETKQGGALQGDSLTRQVENQVRSFLHRGFGGPGQGMRSLSDLGVEIDRNGKLSFDESKFTKALERSREDVIGFFTGGDDGDQGFAVQLDALLGNYLHNTTGMLTVREKGLQTSIARLGEQAERIEMRLVKREENLRRQFLTLERLMADFQSTAGALDQQLQSLSNLNTSISRGRK